MTTTLNSRFIWFSVQNQPSYLLRRMFNTSSEFSNIKIETHNHSPKTIIVEGNIGAGKTTFLKPFMNQPNIEVVPEPVEKWRNMKGHNLLDLFYQNPQRNSMLLQTYVQLTMVQNHTKPCSKPLRIMERSLLSARYCFVENLRSSGKMTDPEYLVLSEWFKYLISAPQLDFHVDEIIYLRTDPEVAHERIKNRHRHEEMKIPLQYLKDLHQLHENWLVKGENLVPKAPVRIIDANGDLDQLREKYQAETNRILYKNQNNDWNIPEHAFQ